MSEEASCAGIPVNTDISGLGVRISMYLQAILTVIIVCVSPADASSAYWSMTVIALGLIVSIIVTAILQDISLMDAIVSTYLLILPVVASSFGIIHLASQPASRRGPNAVRKAHSHLLILTSWLRSALTYSFALFVWAKTPNFGSGPPECDQATRFTFFWASFPALGLCRIINLLAWGMLATAFLGRTYMGKFTLLASIRGLFMGDDIMSQPYDPPAAEIHYESEDHYSYQTDEHSHQETIYRYGHVLHDIFQGMMTQILGWAPSGEHDSYKKYGQLLIVITIIAWAIIMTELTLKRNVLKVDVNNTWGFGQVLSLILTIAPLFALMEALLRRTRGGCPKRRLRFCLVSATGLNHTSNFDPNSCDAQGMPQEQLEAIRSPSPFAVATIDKTDFYNTFYHDNTASPIWQESFDAEVTDTTVIEIRVFDMKTSDKGRPTLVGRTIVTPFSMLYPAHRLGDDGTREDCTAISQEFALVLNDEAIPGALLTFSISKDVTGAPPSPNIPGRYLVDRKTRLARRKSICKVLGLKAGYRRVRRAVINLINRTGERDLEMDTRRLLVPTSD
ncbi:hypothetical protein NMY22_g4232 [Coprinellus aureogranulatus]|nr:hypothetical protein NMY22_g4232 [Coprinellus aureogranulatus]